MIPISSVWERFQVFQNLVLGRVVDSAWGRGSMSKIEEYRANAVECDRMARTARDEVDRRTWQEMAESWLRMAEQKSAAKVEEPRD
jgi:uncharacterized alpha-E superfamily protein